MTAPSSVTDVSYRTHFCAVVTRRHYYTAQLDIKYRVVLSEICKGIIPIRTDVSTFSKRVIHARIRMHVSKILRSCEAYRTATINGDWNTDYQTDKDDAFRHHIKFWTHQTENQNSC